MAVKQESEADNEYFTHMLDLIPTDYYFDNKSKKILRDESEDNEDESEDEAIVSKQSEAHKRHGEELSMKAKWKRAKFDPAQIMTVSQMTEELSNKLAAKTSKDTPDKAPKPQSSMANNEGDLREKLKAKIELMKAKRHALDRKDEFQKRRLKRNELKAKKKMRQKQDRVANGPSNGPLTKKGAKTPAPMSKPVYNKEGKMVFSKFDFSERKQPKPEKKNYKALLEKAQKDKDKVETLKQTDIAAAQNLKQKQQWLKVLDKAEGVAVKDNPELLKKAMKKKEKKKEKSKKVWKEREENVEAKIKQRQDKRTANIKKKKEGRVNKKITKAKKKGRVIPGF